MLAALGIYGVVGLMVATRTREIAVRVALGASRRRVLGMILFDVVKLTTPGVAVGLVLTAALVRLNGENMGISLSSRGAARLRRRRRDCDARRGPRQPRPGTPRRVGPADGGDANHIGGCWRTQLKSPKLEARSQNQQVAGFFRNVLRRSHVDGDSNARGQPAYALSNVVGCARELTFDRLPAFVKV